MNNLQLKAIVTLKTALMQATQCGAFDELLGNALNPDDINTFCDLVNTVVIPDGFDPSAVVDESKVSPHLVLVALSNGDRCLYLNDKVIVTAESDDNTTDPKEIGEAIAVSLGICFTRVSMQTPSDSDWNWDDVCELLPHHQGVTADSTAIRVSLDGGETFFNAPNDVRLIYPDQLVPGEDGSGELHITATQEGLVLDVWVTREEHLDHNIGTSSQMASDLISDMVEDNA